MDKLRGIDETLQRQAPYGVDARERLIKPMATAARANSQVHLLLLTRIHDEVVRWTKRRHIPSKGHGAPTEEAAGEHTVLSIELDISSVHEDGDVCYPSHHNRVVATGTQMRHLSVELAQCAGR